LFKMDTIVAPITPLVRSSVIIIRISGPNAFDVKRYLYINGKQVNELKHRFVYHGEFISDEIKDDVIFYAFHKPNSYTGENVVEISFHGNPLIVQSAIKGIYKLGIRLAEPGEFTKQAFLNGKLDLVQAEAVYELIDSKSISGIQSSFNRLKKGFKNEVEEIKNKILDVLSVVEAYIDFPEEDLSDFELNYVYERLDSILEKVGNLVKSFESFKHLSDGTKVAIVGKPNVGKSSLMNYLLRENRVIVSDIPGTTRDVIEEEFYVGSYPVKLIDTAGIRDSNDAIEVLGIEFSKQKLNEADIILFIYDLEKGIDENDQYIISKIPKEKIIKVGNKLDSKKYDLDTDVDISAKTGLGIEKLINLLENKIKELIFIGENENCLISERQCNIFKEIEDIVLSVKNNFNNLTLDLIAVDLHSCLNKISILTGDLYTEDLLRNIFDKFCIGK